MPPAKTICRQNVRFNRKLQTTLLNDIVKRHCETIPIYFYWQDGRVSGEKFYVKWSSFNIDTLLPSFVLLFETNSFDLIKLDPFPMKYLIDPLPLKYFRVIRFIILISFRCTSKIIFIISLSLLPSFLFFFHSINLEFFKIAFAFFQAST